MKIRIYGEGKRGYNKRQKYTDNQGNVFEGYLEEAREHFRGLYPSHSIIISYYPKKRQK